MQAKKKLKKFATWHQGGGRGALRIGGKGMTGVVMGGGDSGLILPGLKNWEYRTGGRGREIGRRVLQ